MSTTNPTENITEWEDLQIKYGNLPERPKPITNEALTCAAIDFAESQDPFEKKSLQELEELKEDVEEDTLEYYRRRRLAELKCKKEAYKFGEVYHVGKDEYVNEVTQASKISPNQRVVLHLYSNAKPICELLNRSLTILAKRHGDVKFCKAIGSDVIIDFPDSRIPTVLVYKNGVCEHQFLGSSIWGDLHTNANCVEWVLWKNGVVSSVSVDEDPRPKTKSNRSTNAIRYGVDRCDDNSSSSGDEERNADRRGYSSLAMERALHLK